MNRIDYFANALTDWLNEYAEKQSKVGKRNTPEPTADDGGDCGPYEGEYHDSTEYEAAIRMSPHPECCACLTCDLKHRFEEEA